MAYIKNKQRENIIKKINKSYGFRKFLISFEVVALLGFIVISFLSFYFTQSGKNMNWAWIQNDTLTGFGIGMMVWAIVIAILGIIALILTFTIKSPKDVTAKLQTLQSSALSGKKIKKDDAPTDVVRERTTSRKKK